MEGTISVSGMTVAYIDTASCERDKPALLILHGWGASKESFAPVIEALKDDYRVIAPDLPGFGETGEPDKPWSLNDYAAFVQSFIEGVGLAELPFSACGHSHGGRVLIKWTSLYQTGLERLILIDSAGLKSKLSPGRQAKIYMYKAGKTLLRIPLLGEALAPLAERKLAAAGSADYRQASPLMRRTMTLQLGEDLGYCLPLIRVPTLLFWGDGDKETPLEMGKKMERDIPGAGMVVLSPAGHYSYLDQFTVFIKALRYFLEH